MQKGNKVYLILLTLYLLILLIGSLPAIPLPAGRRLFVVSSGSMEPVLPVSSVVITKPQQGYSVGDIITFINPERGENKEKTITHRLEKIINEDGQIVYMTKGDANVFSDGKFIRVNQIVGKVNRQITNLGFLINIVKSKLGLVFLVSIPGLLIINKEIKNIITNLRLNKKKAKNPQRQKEE